MILTGVNFSGVSLRRASLHATNLMNADLRGADLTDANLVEADLIGAQAARCGPDGREHSRGRPARRRPGNARCSLDDLKGALHVSYPFEIRVAGDADVDAIAAAHLDSIQSIGPRFYPADVVRDWGSRIAARMYLNAMASGRGVFHRRGQPGRRRRGAGFLGASGGRWAAWSRGLCAGHRGAPRNRVGAAAIGGIVGHRRRARQPCSSMPPWRPWISTRRTDSWRPAAARIDSARDATMACVFMRRDLTGLAIQ